MRMLVCLLILGPLVSSALASDPSEPKFRAETIDDKIEIGYGVTTGDVDGDGKPDILLADKRQFIWYRNPTWEKFILAENLTKRDNVCIAAQDIDGDGKCEIAVGGDWAPDDRENSGAVFYLVAPEDRTQRWEAVNLHAEPTVHRMRWMKLGDGTWGLIVAPLHGRGEKGDQPSRILLYHKPDDVRQAWMTELIDDSMHATHAIEVVPGGILIAGREGLLQISRREDRGQITYAKQQLPMSKSAGEVRREQPQIAFQPPFPITAAIEPMHGSMLVVYDWYARRFRHVVTEKLVEGHALACAHLTSPHFVSLVVGWRGDGGGLSTFNRVNKNATQWRETVIDDGGMACEDLCLADLNGDKKLDIIASGRATKNVKIYWNETPAE